MIYELNYGSRAWSYQNFWQFIRFFHRTFIVASFYINHSSRLSVSIFAKQRKPLWQFSLRILWRVRMYYEHSMALCYFTSGSAELVTWEYSECYFRFHVLICMALYKILTVSIVSKFFLWNLRFLFFLFVFCFFTLKIKKKKNFNSALVPITLSPFLQHCFWFLAQLHEPVKNLLCFSKNLT